MVQKVREMDPALFERIGDGPLTEAEVVEPRTPSLGAGGDALAARIDARLGSRTSLLVDYTSGAEPTTAEAVRTLLGLGPDALSDDAALELLLEPGRNRYRLETLNLSVHAPLSRAMHHPRTRS